MIPIIHSRDMNRLRRIALASQGLLKSHPFGGGYKGTLKAINHIGYVQVDTISVVQRAHHHVLHARVANFKAEMTNQMLLAGDIFEYWTHAAAFIPISDFRFSLPYKHAIKDGQTHWYKNPNKKLMKNLLERIKNEGPLRSRDLETSNKKRAGWWDWKPAKKAIEQLYMQGDLMVSDREGFQKTYDLTERVLPSCINTQYPTIKEFAKHLLDQQLRCHGLVSLKGLTYQRKNVELRKAVKELVNDRLMQNKLEQIQLAHGDVFVIEKGKLEQPLPRLSNRMLILSPFDNSAIQRERLRTLFQFNYQLECYLPETKRQFGYFSLPLLYRDEFIGRMDCKAHRKTKRLEIKFLHLEKYDFDLDSLIKAFTKAVAKFVCFQNCDSVFLTKMHPKKLTAPFQNVLKDISLN